MRKIVLLDLDGTIFDSSSGVIRSMRYAFDTQGLEITDEELRTFIGPPFKESLAKKNIVGDQATPLIKNYLFAYNNPVNGFEEGYKSAVTYAGMDDFIKKLYSDGIILLTATTKVEYSAKSMITAFNFDKYFHGVFGCVYEVARLTKEQVIHAALSSINYDKNTDKCIMVGDREFDVIGGTKNGIPVIGVNWGYALTEDELKSAKATYIVDTMDQLKDTVYKYFED